MEKVGGGGGGDMLLAYSMPPCGYRQSSSYAMGDSPSIHGPNAGQNIETTEVRLPLGVSICVCVCVMIQRSRLGYR